VSATSVNLLVAAAEIVGGNRALARRLGIGETLLAQFMNDSRQLPDLLLLRAVDIILSDRQARLPPVRG
jgi:DNA-binding transcriptional regulator YdaS (Cro superfamily)